MCIFFSQKNQIKFRVKPDSGLIFRRAIRNSEFRVSECKFQHDEAQKSPTETTRVSKIDNHATYNNKTL